MPDYLLMRQEIEAFEETKKSKVRRQRLIECPSIYRIKKGI